MPLQVQPDGKGGWIWVDSATGQPAAQPGGPGTPYVSSEQPPTSYPPPVTIAPTTQPATTQPSSTQQPASSVGAPQGPNGSYTVAQILAPFDDEFTKANQAVLDLNTQINGRHGATDAQGNPLPDQQGDVDALTTAQTNAYPGDPRLNSATAKYQSDVAAYTAAQQRLEAANTARSSALQEAIKANTLNPSQVALAQAQANESTKRATQIDSEVQIAQQLAPSQIALVSAQAAQASNSALLDQANANAVAAKTPQDIATARAQQNLYQAQADNISALIEGNKQKLQADTTLTQHQVGLTDSQSTYYQSQAAEAAARGQLESAQADYQRALTAGAPALQAGQTAEAAGAGAASQAQAQATLESIRQKQLGPAYGLQDQINAIRAVQQQVFGPGGSGDPSDANDLLKQYVTATLGGTTIGQASAAAATAQQNNYATQMGGTNALQAAMANRANAYAGAEGNVLGTLAGMNQYAPKGSTAGAGAFQAVMDDMAQRLASPQFAPVQLPQAPALPPFLQAFAAGHQAGQAQASAQGSGQAAPTVNINVNGQPQTPATTGPAFNPQASTAAMNAAGFLDSPAGRAAMAMLGASGGQSATGAGPTTPAAPSGTGFASPPPIVAPPATAANTDNPQQAFANGLSQGASSIPNFAQNYMAFASPMNMIGYKGYLPNG